MADKTWAGERSELHAQHRKALKLAAHFHTTGAHDLADLYQQTARQLQTKINTTDAPMQNRCTNPGESVQVTDAPTFAPPHEMGGASDASVAETPPKPIHTDAHHYHSQDLNHGWQCPHKHRTEKAADYCSPTNTSTIIKCPNKNAKPGCRETSTRIHRSHLWNTVGGGAQ